MSFNKAGFEKDAITPMQWVGLKLTPLLKYMTEKGGKGMSWAGSKSPKLSGVSRGGARVTDASNWLGKVHTEGLGGSEEALNSLGNIGGWATTAAAIPAGVGIASGIGAHRRNKEEEKIQTLVDKLSTGEIKAAANQKAFEEGFLTLCRDLQLDTKRTVDVLEKGAERKDGVGENCRQLIDRLVGIL
jgi:hypothetical protein